MSSIFRRAAFPLASRKLQATSDRLISGSRTLVVGSAAGIVVPSSGWKLNSPMSPPGSRKVTRIFAVSVQSGIRFCNPLAVLRLLVSNASVPYTFSMPRRLFWRPTSSVMGTPSTLRRRAPRRLLLSFCTSPATARGPSMILNVRGRPGCGGVPVWSGSMAVCPSPSAATNGRSNL